MERTTTAKLTEGTRVYRVTSTGAVTGTTVQAQLKNKTPKVEVLTVSTVEDVTPAVTRKGERRTLKVTLEDGSSYEYPSSSFWYLAPAVTERTAEQNEQAKKAKARKARKTTKPAAKKAQRTEVPKVGKGGLTAPDETRTYNQILESMLARGYTGPTRFSTKYELLAREAQMPNS